MRERFHLMAIMFLGTLIVTTGVSTVLVCTSTAFAQDETPALPDEDPPAVVEQPADQPAEQPGDQPAEKTVRKYPENISDDQKKVLDRYYDGRDLMEEKKYALAVQAFNQVLTGDSRFLPAIYERGKCFSELKMYDLSLESLNQAVVLGRNSPQAFLMLFERGKVHVELGNLDDALDDFLHALERQPTNPEFLYHRGAAFVKLGSKLAEDGSLDARQQLTNAIDSLDRAIAANNNYAEAYNDRGLAKVQLSQLEEALEDFKTASDLDKSSFDYRQRLGIAHLQRANQLAAINSKDDTQAIIDHFHSAIATLSEVATEKPVEENPPEIAEIHVVLAEARIGIARQLPENERKALYEDALRDCDEAIVIEPRQAHALFVRGLVLRMMNKYQEAIDHFTEALQLSPSYSEARLRRGIVWFHLDQYDLALNDFEQIGGSEDPRPWFWQGLVHAQLGDYSEAVRTYTEALRGARPFSMAHSNRGLAYLHMGRYERALQDFNQLIQLKRTDAMPYYYRAVAHQQLGNRGKAIHSYKQALKFKPDFTAAKQALTSLENTPR